MTKRDLIFLNQMIKKLASPYFVENDLYEYDRLQWATGVTREDLYKSIKLIEKYYKKTKDKKMIQIEINEDLKKQFEEDGYLILPQFLDTTKIASIANKFANLFSGIFETGIEPDEWNWKKGRDPNNITRQICNGWKSD